jgi:hypothetical protein
MMLTRNLTQLITNGTSGLSKALVAAATAVSIVPARTVNDAMRTYVRLACRTWDGTKLSAKADAALKKMMLRIRPATPSKRISVCVNCSLLARVLDALSPMMTQAALGRPSLIASAAVFKYV